MDTRQNLKDKQNKWRVKKVGYENGEHIVSSFYLLKLNVLSGSATTAVQDAAHNNNETDAEGQQKVIIYPAHDFLTFLLPTVTFSLHRN